MGPGRTYVGVTVHIRDRSIDRHRLISSLVPRPCPLMKKKGLVTIEQFLGCADSAVLI